MNQLDQNRYSVLLFGGAGVGKSTLVNGLVGREVAATSGRLNAVTGETRNYEVSYSAKGMPKQKVTFWDTAGIMDWTQLQVVNVLDAYLKETKPICALICFAPSERSDEQLISVLCEELKNRSIFVGLVLTKMYSDAQSVADTWKSMTQIANRFIGQIEETKRDKRNREFFVRGEFGLLVKVNSKQQTIEDAHGELVHFPDCHLEYVIYGILRGLGNDDVKIQWLLTIVQNRPLLMKIQHLMTDWWSGFVAWANRWLPGLFPEP